MKTNKKLLASAMALGLAALSTVGSTFAWFSMNTTVSASGMSLTATSPVNLLINNTASSSGTFANSVTANESLTGKLIPASSSDGLKFNAITAGNYLGDGKGGVATSTTQFEITSNQAGSPVIAMSGSANGYWAEYDFALKLSEKTAADQLVYLNKLLVEDKVIEETGVTYTLDANSQYNGFTYYTDSTCATLATASTALTSASTYYKKQNLAAAVRVAVFYSDEAAYTSAVAIYANANASASYSAITGEIDAIGTNTTTTTVTPVKAAAGGTIAYNALQKYTLHKETTPVAYAKLVVWIEGQDPACINANAGATFNISVGWSIYNG